jgi:hypothetical protein
MISVGYLMQKCGELLCYKKNNALQIGHSLIIRRLNSL